VDTRLIGRPVEDIDTPALVVDLAVLQRNIDALQRAARRAQLELRPHIKAHKTSEIARMQLAAGAAGITAAKVSEAEAMLPCGAEEVFIANQVVGEAKVARMVELSEGVRLSAAVDSLAVAQGYSAAFAHSGRVFDVLIDVDSGSGRCGVRPDDAPGLARGIAGMPGLHLAGIMSYGGGAYAARGREGFERAAAEEGRFMAAVADRLQADGHIIARISGGTTPTGPHYALGCGLTEIRSGTYALNDMNQVDLGAAQVGDIAATILATVISTSQPGRVILDAGSKALATQVTPLSPGCGWVLDDLSAVVDRLNDEHGYLDIRRAMRTYAVGDKVRVIPPRICTALNLYDALYLCEDGRVADVLPIAGRGRSQ